MSQNTSLDTIMDPPTKTFASLLAPLMFAGLHNHFPVSVPFSTLDYD